MTTNPATGVTEREFPTLPDDQLDALAKRSLDAYTQWRDTSPAARAEMLSRTADLYEKRADELAAAITTETVSYTHLTLPTKA